MEGLGSQVRACWRNDYRCRVHLFGMAGQSLAHGTLTMYDRVWITRDGRYFKVSDMSTEHIVHCIQMIINSGGKWRREYLPRLELELIIRSLK